MKQKTAHTVKFQGNLTTFLLYIVVSAAMTTTWAASVCATSGYDENTQVVVVGTVKKVSENHPSGYNCIVIRSQYKNYRILTAPAWYARKIGLNFHPGAEIQVVGSKFYTADGNIYLMARSIKSLDSGRYIALRDDRCNPLWQRYRNKGESCMRIFFHPGHHSF